MITPYQTSIDVRDDLSEVSRVQEKLSGLWESRNLPPDVEMDVSVALEEVLSNVLRHSVVVSGSREVRVTFAVDGAWFEFEVSDSAAAYDPLSRPEPDVNLPLSEREAGGLGVFLARRLADEVSYERRAGRNCLRFRKRFPTA